MKDEYQPPPGLPPILHRDRDLLAVDKPAGLLSVPGSRAGWQDSALSRLQAAAASDPQGGLWAVHRLDMDTSGVLVLALRRRAEAALRAQFAGRQARKTYIAVVAGHPPDEGRVELPLRRLGGWPPRNAVDIESGLPALTRFQVLLRLSDRSRVALFPETGRSHQLRLHMAALGHPILGDRFYAPPEIAGAAPRLMLHALRLELLHPWSGQPLHLEAPAPF